MHYDRSAAIPMNKTLMIADLTDPRFGSRVIYTLLCIDETK
jgi:hypothetical protein